MPEIKASGAAFNAIKAAATGEFDVQRGVEIEAGAKLGKLSTSFKSTISDPKITQAIVDYARTGRTSNAEGNERIKNVLALSGKGEIPASAKLLNPVNILAALACIGKNEDTAALKVMKLFFLLKQAEFKQLDKLAAGIFGGSVRQAVSGGFGEFGKEQITGFAGMAKAAQLALDAIQKKV